MVSSGVVAYASQTRWTDPGASLGVVQAAGSVPAGLPGLVSGQILHPGLASMRGIVTPAAAENDQDIRSMAEMLDVMLERSPAPLWAERPPEDRFFGICRHYALMAAAILRTHGVPARLRAGFATYFTPGWAEDHWVCEYHDGASWKLLDAELDETTQQQLRIGFEPHDVPRDRFLSAAQVWRDARNGDLDVNKVGLRGLGIKGLWFVAGSLLRDVAALNREELQPWDVWGPTRDLGPLHPIEPEWVARFDALAAALIAEPPSLPEARALWTKFPWAALGETILSYRLEPIEIRLG